MISNHLNQNRLISVFIGSLLFAFLFFNISVQAQDNLKKGWDNFNNNNIPKAREYFTNALSDEKAKPEAYLMLTVLATIDKNEEETFRNFEKFYASSDDPMPYVEALLMSNIAFDGLGKKEKPQLALLKKILNDPRASGTLKDKIHGMLGSHFESIQEDKKSLEEYSKIETLTNWQITGVFDNISASGFDKDYEPIKNPVKKTGFKNKYGAVVNWFKLPPSRNDKWIDFTYNFYAGNGICYAQTFVNSNENKEVQFRIGVSGSLKTWVNDNLVFSESEERNNGEDSYIFKIRLKKGYNRILIQIGSSEIDNSNFMARITDESGNSLSEFTSTDEPQKYSPDAGYTTNQIPVAEEAYFQKKIEQSPDKLVNYLVLATAYMTNSKNYEARKLLLKAQEMAPKNSYIYYKLLEIYSAEGNKTDLEIGIAWMKDNDPDNPSSLAMLYNEELEKENYKGARDIVDKMEKKYGETAYSLEKRITLAAKDGKQDELIQLALDGYKKYPDRWYFVNLKQIIEGTVNKDKEASIKVIKKYLKDNFRESAYTTLAKHYFEKGSVSEGIEQYEILFKKNPYGIGYCKDLGDIYFSAQKYEKSIEYYKKCLSIAPYISNYWNALAKCYDNMNKTEEAKDAYKNAITYLPTNFDARRALRKLENKKDVFDYFDPVDITALYKKSPDASEYPEDNSLILNEESQKVVYSGGAWEEKNIIVVKVFNAQGIDTWKEYGIPSYGSQRLIIEKAETLKKNGARVAAETDEGNVVFKSLEPGDAISLTYRVESYASGKLAECFSDKKYFSHRMPYLETKYSLLIAPEIKFNYRFSNDTIVPLISKADEFQMYKWVKENEPSIKTEERMPVLCDVACVFHISSFPDWNYISHSYSDLAATKAKSDFEVKETVAKLMKGKENYSTEKKVEEIYNYIVKNIRYSSVSFLQSGLIPQKASHVLNSKIGDCKDVATLFVAMCKEINVDAQLVLVDTKDNGEKDIMLPSLDFNHCIAKCTIDHKDYYVELTSDYLPFDSYYSSDLHSLVLDIKNEKDKSSCAPYFLDPAVRKPNNITRVSKVSLKNDDIIIDRINYRTGQFAAISRKNFRDMGVKERQKEMLKNVSEEYANVQIDSLRFTGLDARNDTVSYEYILTGADAVTHVEGLSLLTLPWIDKATSKDFVFESHRQFPIDVSSYQALENDHEEISLKIPAGKTISAVPKNISYTCAIADYKISYKLSNGRLKATRDLKFKMRTVPVSNIPEFKEFYKKVIAADAKQIAMK